MKDKIEVRIHVIDAEGLCKTSKKIEGALKALEPKNMLELRTFLGLVNYNGRFTEICPLYNLHEETSILNRCRTDFRKCRNL